MRGLGKNIKKYRNTRKLSQEELGDRVGVTKSFISKVENDKTKISLETLANIADVLEVDIGDILGGKKELPMEIKEAGGDWLILGEELEEQGITPEQVKQWAEIVKNYSQLQSKKT